MARSQTARLIKSECRRYSNVFGKPNRDCLFFGPNLCQKMARDLRAILSVVGMVFCQKSAAGRRKHHFRVVRSLDWVFGRRIFSLRSICVAALVIGLVTIARFWLLTMQLREHSGRKICSLLHFLASRNTSHSSNSAHSSSATSKRKCETGDAQFYCATHS